MSKLQHIESNNYNMILKSLNSNHLQSSMWHFSWTKITEFSPSSTSPDSYKKRLGIFLCVIKVNKQTIHRLLLSRSFFPLKYSVKLRSPLLCSYGKQSNSLHRVTTTGQHFGIETKIRIWSHHARNFRCLSLLHSCWTHLYQIRWNYTSNFRNNEWSTN